ncbi:MAG: hypothetical protein OXC79_05415 [Candidatus Poribacteria bacterium]|nr:hypothetical protein [Candidatus Poribacteria bacterium]
MKYLASLLLILCIFGCNTERTYNMVPNLSDIEKGLVCTYDKNYSLKICIKIAKDQIPVRTVEVPVEVVVEKIVEKIVEVEKGKVVEIETGQVVEVVETIIETKHLYKEVDYKKLVQLIIDALPEGVNKEDIDVEELQEIAEEVVETYREEEETTETQTITTVVDVKTAEPDPDPQEEADTDPQEEADTDPQEEVDTDPQEEVDTDPQEEADTDPQTLTIIVEPEIPFVAAEENNPTSAQTQADPQSPPPEVTTTVLTGTIKHAHGYDDDGNARTHTHRSTEFIHTVIERSDFDQQQKDDGFYDLGTPDGFDLDQHLEQYGYARPPLPPPPPPPPPPELPTAPAVGNTGSFSASVSGNRVGDTSTGLPSSPTEAVTAMNNQWQYENVVFDITINNISGWKLQSGHNEQITVTGTVGFTGIDATFGNVFVIGASADPATGHLHTVFSYIASNYLSLPHTITLAGTLEKDIGDGHVAVIEVTSIVIEINGGSNDSFSYTIKDIAITSDPAWKNQ